MSILEFMEMNVLECVLGSVLAFMICLSYSGIGSVFAPKRGVMFQSVLGMTFMGAIGVLGAEFCAGLVKYLIGLFAIVGFAILSVRIITQKVSIKNILISMMPALIFYVIAFINILVIVLPKSGVFPYNCHQTYFSGVPLEILNADYFSRLRIMDVYPFEWSKYHFFNGAYISIPLIAFAKGNYVSYLFAKMISISYYVGAIFDLLKSKYSIKKTYLYLGLGLGVFFVCAHNGIVWSMGTNNYSCIAMCLIAWILFEEKSYSEATLFSIGYAITKSGSIVSGGCLFLLGLFWMYKTDNLTIIDFLKKRYREAIFSLIVGVGILSTVFAGSDRCGLSSNVLESVSDVIQGMFHAGWMELLPMGAAIGCLDLYAIHFEFLYIALVIYLLIKNRANFVIIKKHKNFFVATVVVVGLYLVGSMYIIGRIKWGLTAFLICYILPFMVVFVCEKGKSKVLYLVFTVSLVINFVLFEPGITIPNYCIIVFISLCFFVKQVVEDIEAKRKYCQRILCMITVVGIVYFAVYDWQEILFLNPDDTYHEELLLEGVDYTNRFFVYNSSDDAKLAKLNALKGNRVHYNILPDRRDETMAKTSMAMSFLSKGYEKYYENVIN